MYNTVDLAAYVVVMGLFWIVGAVVVAAIFGTDRTCGFWRIFAIGFFLSPVVGFLTALHYPTIVDRANTLEQTRLLQEILTSLNKKEQAP